MIKINNKIIINTTGWQDDTIDVDCRTKQIQEKNYLKIISLFIYQAGLFKSSSILTTPSKYEQYTRYFRQLLK